ncbi:MAG: inorganic diphosphatase [Candidatus Acidiferrales bacterium]
MKAFVQNEAGSRIKHSHNEKTLALLGTSGVSRAYPFPYGFILDTAADDGLSVDCFFLTEKPLSTGLVVECDPIGLMEQFEDGKIDHNVLAVIRSEKVPMTQDVERALTEFVSHVFDHIPGKTIRVGMFRGREDAIEYISSHRDSPDSAHK